MIKDDEIWGTANKANLTRKLGISAIIHVSRQFGDSAEMAVEQLRSAGHEVEIHPNGSYQSGNYQFIDGADGIVTYARMK